MRRARRPHDSTQTFHGILKQLLASARSWYSHGAVRRVAAAPWEAVAIIVVMLSPAGAFNPMTLSQPAEQRKVSSPNAELFAVAPMAQHTTRHWRHVFRLLSKRAHLYTEMTRASKLIEAAEDEALLRFQYAVPEEVEGPVVLQLGGHDPKELAAAAKIGAQLGYHAINLNCGCPSTLPPGAPGPEFGAALMHEPAHVADCCAAMIEAVSCTEGPSPPVTVKHRLGVADAASFDPDVDRHLGDGPAFDSARRFIETVAASGVDRFHVHARLALLGYADPTSSLMSDRGPDKLWTKARLNREAPPLRLSVVHELAAEYPQLDIIANGGLRSFDDVRAQLSAGCAGAMVGRAAINHPCGFAAVDDLWGLDAVEKPLTRGEVLDRHIEYCEAQERAAAALPSSKEASKETRMLPGKLAAAAFKLFVGLEGANKFERYIRKTVHHPGNHNGQAMVRQSRFSGSAILKGARAQLPPEALDADVRSAIPYSDIKIYEKAPRAHASLQRLIY
mmetsp:Transcript_114867/g.198972  ORF Transcript_114867/g.198972 Transcript_114867/m.198972 type:complete len:505 (-) Transcript_114867:12-1526(-)